MKGETRGEACGDLESTGEVTDEEAAVAIVEELRASGEWMWLLCWEEVAELRLPLLLLEVVEAAVVRVVVAAAVGSDSLSGCGAPLRPIAGR